MAEEKDAVKLKRTKQNRVRKMKSFIVSFVIIALFVSLVCNVILVISITINLFILII